MDARAAHLLERGLLAGDHLDHPVRAEVHRRVALDHDDDVAERRDVGAAGRRRPEQRAHLRDGAAGPHLVPEDLAGAAPAGEQVDLVGDPRAGRVDQVDHRHAGPVRGLDDADDLLDRAGAPRPGLDRRVVGHQGDRPSVDGRGAGHDTVRGQVTGDDVREGAVLDEGALVDEQPHPLAGEQLALAGVGLVVLLRAATLDPGPQVGHRRVLGEGVVLVVSTRRHRRHGGTHLGTAGGAAAGHREEEGRRGA